MLIRIATRKSALAMWQAEHVAGGLRSLPEVGEVTLVPISTRGDEILDRSLQKIGGKGLFIKELELAMRTDKADIAVHSMKDVPANMPAGFCIAALLPRGDPGDALVTADGSDTANIGKGARVGSSSLRRQAQLLAMRPDLVVEPLRGNVNTRLDKLARGDFDAIVLACAGLERLGLDSHIAERLSPEMMLPAATQGVIGIECLADRDDLAATLARLDHPATRSTTAAERAVPRRLEASCQSPLASYAEIDGGMLALRALVATPDGRTVIRAAESGDPDAAESIGEKVAASLLAQGAGELLKNIPS